MGGCRCSYRSCRSATKVSGELHFFHYPVKHKERCEQWIVNAQKPEFFNLPDDQLRNKVICDLHFEPRFFTNVQRKRLVHDAVPSINAGCDDPRQNENSNEYKDVQILPANADGTIFTVDTDSMQQRIVSDPICTYSFRNGSLIPVYTEDSADTEQVVYTIGEDDFKNLTNYNENAQESKNYVYVDEHDQEEEHEKYEVIFNGNSGHSQDNRKYQGSNSMVINLQDKRRAEETMEVVYITEQREEPTESGIVIKKEPEPETSRRLTRPREIIAKVKEINRNVSSKHVKKKFIKQIKLHSKEIASIKRTLNAGLKKPQKMNIVTALKGKISPTLLGALTLNLSKKVSNFTSEEYEFLTTLYQTSPELYTTLIDKLNWSLPAPAVVNALIKSSKYRTDNIESV